ncbi:MAG: cytoplasmic protein, partial [Pseudomonadota bacterium]
HNVLPERLFETAYALAVDVSVADFYFKREETRFAQMLAEELDIDEATCSAIRVAARARHRRL